MPRWWCFWGNILSWVLGLAGGLLYKYLFDITRFFKFLIRKINFRAQKTTKKHTCGWWYQSNILTWVLGSRWRTRKQIVTIGKMAGDFESKNVENWLVFENFTLFKKRETGRSAAERWFSCSIRRWRRKKWHIGVAFFVAYCPSLGWVRIVPIPRWRTATDGA